MDDRRVGFFAFGAQHSPHLFLPVPVGSKTKAKINHQVGWVWKRQEKWDGRREKKGEEGRRREKKAEEGRGEKRSCISQVTAFS